MEFSRPHVINEATIEYLNTLAEDGNATGMVELGKLLIENGDEESKEMAYVWFEGAASLDNSEATSLLKKYFDQ